MNRKRCAVLCLVLLTLLLGQGSWASNADHEYLVGAYYYPWYAYGLDEINCLRSHLVPAQHPQLGAYSDRDPAVIAQHLAWSREAGIDFWATSWWAPEGPMEETLHDYIMPRSDLGDLKIAIMYETIGRTNSYTDYSNIGPDITYLAANYFSHPNYLKVNGKPVLFVYLTRDLASFGTLESTVATMRAAASAAGFGLYIVGDHVFGALSNPDRMVPLDAVTNYDVYGSLGVTGYAGQAAVDQYTFNQGQWRDAAHSLGLGFVPSVMPGLNDTGVRSGHAPLSRKLTADAEEGSLFRAILKGAKTLADADLNHMLMVTSFNEWYEDTAIEPVGTAAPTTEDISGTHAYTHGLPYEGYGSRYLNILAEETIPLTRSAQMFDSELQSLLAAHEWDGDLDNDGLPEAFALRLIGTALTSGNYSFSSSLEAAYQANLTQLAAETISLDGQREVLAALLLSGQTLRDFLVQALGLTGTYSVAQDGAAELFSAGSDPDQDGSSNLAEYGALEQSGLGINHYPDFALDSDWDANTAMPSLKSWSLVLLAAVLLGLGGGILFRARNRKLRRV